MEFPVLSFTYWRSGRFWIGHLDDYPDYETQGETWQELQENLQDIYLELNSGRIPGVRRRGQLHLKKAVGA